MSRLFNLRLLAAVTTISLVALFGASSALADSAQGNQNPSFSVSVSLLGDGFDPNVATLGDTVTAGVAVKNTSFVAQYVRVYVIADWGYGHSPDFDRLRLLQPGEVWEWKGKLHVTKKLLGGEYSLRVAAFGGDVVDASEATAYIRAV